MNTPELHQILRLVFALVFVLALMGGLGVAMRRINAGRVAGGRTARLGVVEALPIDSRRRLVLVRRDGVEHLLLLGANGETVVERGIKSGQDESDRIPDDSTSAA